MGEMADAQIEDGLDALAQGLEDDMGDVAEDHEEKYFDRRHNMDWSTLHFDDVKHHTEKAVLFIVGEDEVWVPKSVIDVVYDDEAWDAMKGQGPGEIDIAEWFAEKEGL